jgi:hypothetical protein
LSDAYLKAVIEIQKTNVNFVSQSRHSPIYLALILYATAANGGKEPFSTDAAAGLKGGLGAKAPLQSFAHWSPVLNYCAAIFTIAAAFRIVFIPIYRSQ